MVKYILKAPRQIEACAAETAAPTGTEVLLRVHHIGICGSDIHLFKGSYSAPHSYPMLFGHEWAGTVAAVGERVSKVTPGDLVTGDCSRYCDACENCKTDKNLCSHIQKFGITIDGASAEYIVRDEKYLYKAPEGIRDDLLCLAEPVAVASHLLEKVKRALGDKFKGQNILVLGGGVIGMSAAMLLRHAESCETVSLYDLSSRRVQVAASAGMRIPAADELAPQADGADYASMYAGAKYDIVLETTGVAPVFANALKLVKPGGILGCVGMIDQVKIAQKLIVTKALTVLGSIGGTGNFDKALDFLCKYPQYAEMLISQHFPISEFEAAFETACDPEKSMKIVFDL